MDFLLDQNNALLLTLAVVSGTMLLLQSARKGAKGASVSVQEAIRMVNHQRALMIDIRTPEQFKAGSIAQARNVPHNELSDKANTLPKDKPIILFCDAGRQSVSATTKLRKLGFEQAVSLQGGLRAWVDAGVPLAHKA